MSWFSKLFNSGKHDTTFHGSLTQDLRDMPGGKEYYDTIMNRLQGRNVGFGPDYAEKYANPIINESRSNFTSYQIPELTSELSRTGRRRGSGGFDQIRRAYQEQGNNENAVFSQLQQRNEDQSRNEINDALARSGQFAQDEATTRDNSVKFQKQLNDDQVAQANARRANESAGLQNLVGAATDFLSPYAYSAVNGIFSRLGARNGLTGFNPLTMSTPPVGYNLGLRSTTTDGYRKAK